MKLFVFIVCVYFMQFNTFGQSAKETIRWGTKEITWEDYKGRPNSASAAMTMSVIHIGLEYPSNLKAAITIEALLNKNTSWVRTKTPTLLLHEKSHFDIAELFARKLRKEISSISPKEITFEEEVFAKHKKFCIAMDAYQDKYDIETDFSRNTEKQKGWNELILRQLEELKQYSEIILMLDLQK
jgi:predicted secreted Zn-dependent protease